MSEPDISTLARRLAEQNNVDWQSLGGSGPSGKVVERDVLDYLARVMAGMEDIDSTPEPLPKGLEAWPDQDAPSSVRDVATVDADVAAAAEDAILEADPAREVAEAATPPAGEDSTFVDDDVDPVDDDLLSDDIFLFGSDEPAEEAAATSHDLPDEVATSPSELPDEDATPASELPDEFATHASELPDEVATSPNELPDEVDDLLLVEDEADVIHDQAQADAQDDGPDAISAFLDEESAPPFDAPSSTYSAADGSGFSSDAFTSDEASGSVPAGTGSYAEPDSDHDDAWGVQPQTSDPFGFSDDPTFDGVEDESLPDLWASGDAQPQETAADEPFGAVESADGAGPWLSSHDAEPEVEAPSPMGEALAHASDDWHDGDDLTTLDDAAHLDELDALEDVEAMDGLSPELDVGAAVAALPLVRSGAVLRRHIDVSALAAAQLAVGVELGGDPLEAAPFLLRAVARAAAELGITAGQVALAELGEGVTLRRVDHADSRTFRSLIEDLAQGGSEEDEVGLIAVDLSGLDVDEVVLDVAAPAVTLGRILYDNQHGAYRSTLALTGELPLEKGAKLLSRVAELLDAPVRLLL